VNAWVLHWLRAFALTVAVEAVVATPLVGRAESRIGRRLAVVLLVNLATHPLVWFLAPGLAAGHAVRLALSEAWAFAARRPGTSWCGPASARGARSSFRCSRTAPRSASASSSSACSARPGEEAGSRAGAGAPHASNAFGYSERSRSAVTNSTAPPIMSDAMGIGTGCLPKRNWK
jgi:hypothetical protein